MSVIPAFNPGIWNAWILALIFILLRIAFGRKISKKTPGRIGAVINGVLLLLLAYSIFLPLALCTAWFYAGLGVFLFGSVLLRIAVLPWATTPAHEPVTTGLYRYSRHPFYLAMLMQLVGMGIASASWIFLLASIVIIVPMNILMGMEEVYCLTIYGEGYGRYMTRTSRWIEIPKWGRRR